MIVVVVMEGQAAPGAAGPLNRPNQQLFKHLKDHDLQLEIRAGKVLTAMQLKSAKV
jgi:hypothetical protein